MDQPLLPVQLLRCFHGGSASKLSSQVFVLSQSDPCNENKAIHVLRARAASCLDSIKHKRDPRPLAMHAYTALVKDTECLVQMKAVVQRV